MNSIMARIDGERSFLLIRLARYKYPYLTREAQKDLWGLA